MLHKKLKSDLRTGILYLVTDKNAHNNLEISNVLIKDIFYENHGFIRDKKEVKHLMAHKVMVGVLEF